MDPKEGALFVQELRSQQKILANELDLMTKKIEQFEQRLAGQAPSRPIDSESEHRIDAVKSEECEVGHTGNDLRFFLSGIYKLLTCSWIMVLLITVPFALASSAFSPVVTFVICMAAIIPLAKLLGEATVQLDVQSILSFLMRF